MPIKTFTPVSAGKWPLLVKGVCSLGLILTMILWSQVMPLPPPHFEISKMKKIISDNLSNANLVWMLELQVQLRRPFQLAFMCRCLRWSKSGVESKSLFNEIPRKDEKELQSTSQTLKLS